MKIDTNLDVILVPLLFASAYREFTPNSKQPRPTPRALRPAPRTARTPHPAPSSYSFCNIYATPFPFGRIRERTSL